MFQIKNFSNRKLAPHADCWERGAEEIVASKARETLTPFYHVAWFEFETKKLAKEQEGRFTYCIENCEEHSSRSSHSS